MTTRIILITTLKACTPYGITRFTNTAADEAYLKTGIMIRNSLKHHTLNLNKICETLWATGIPFTGL
jgi:hypothetical protein